MLLLNHRKRDAVEPKAEQVHEESVQKKKKKKRFILKKDKKIFKKILDTLQKIAYNIIVRLEKERGSKWHCS